MPTRKKKQDEIITGITHDIEEKLVVQKSNPLYNLWRSDMTLSEFKILDVYISRINSHDPDRREVVFEKGELEYLMGVEKINTAALKARMASLHRNAVITIDIDDRGDHQTISLFEKSVCLKDEFGLWTVRLMCTPTAKEYFFNIEKIGYFRYKLHAITVLQSRYSYILFTFLEKNRFRKSWVIDFNELKSILRCDDLPTYREYKEFNKQILKKAHTEINEKTECRFTYEPIRKGRSVTAIRFTLETLADILPEDDAVIQYSLFNAPERNEEESERYFSDSDPRDLFQDALPGFTKAECEVLIALLFQIPTQKMPGYDIDPLEIRRYNFLALQVKRMAVANERKPIKDKFKYLQSMLEKELNEE